MGFIETAIFSSKEKLALILISDDNPKYGYQHIDQNSRSARQSSANKSAFFKISKTLKNK